MGKQQKAVPSTPVSLSSSSSSLLPLRTSEMLDRYRIRNDKNNNNSGEGGIDNDYNNNNNSPTVHDNSSNISIHQQQHQQQQQQQQQQHQQQQQQTESQQITKQLKLDIARYIQENNILNETINAIH